MNELVFYPPDASLSTFIDGYIYSKIKFDGFERPFFTPKGTAALVNVLEISPNSYLEYPDKSSKIYFEKYATYLFGQMSKMSTSYFEERYEFFVIVFTPVGLFHFLEGPASQMTDRVMKLDQLGMPEFDQNLRNLFQSTLQADALVTAVNKIMMDCFKAVPPKKVFIDMFPVTRQILLKKGVIDLENLVKQLGINNRTFQIQFKNQVGISPKLFCRIIRFNALLLALDASFTTDILDLSLQFGYSDNSHLYKDFKEFLRMTPRKYLQLIKNYNAQVEREIKKPNPG